MRRQRRARRQGHPLPRVDERGPPGETLGTTHYSFLVREPNGAVRSVYEAHPFGLFPQATWVRLFERCGFDVEVVEEETTEERHPRLMFVGRKRP